MTHTDALNLILANACPTDVGADVLTFCVSVHCMEFRVLARLVSTVNTIQYEIVEVTPW